MNITTGITDAEQQLVKQWLERGAAVESAHRDADYCLIFPAPLMMLSSTNLEPERLLDL